jgi:hypothetical protein
LFRRPKTRRPVKEHFPRSSRAKRDSALKNQGLAGHRAAASVIVRATTRCPASAAMFSSPTASPLPLFPPRLDERCGRSTQPFPVRAATLKTPEAGPLSDARAKIRACRATLVVRAHLRRRVPRPKMILDLVPQMSNNQNRCFGNYSAACGRFAALAPRLRSMTCLRYCPV